MALEFLYAARWPGKAIRLFTISVLPGFPIANTNASLPEKIK